MTRAAQLLTEGLLRKAIYLTDAQQVKALRAYLKHRDKGKFKTQCTYDRAENDLVAEAERQLMGLPDEYLAQAVAEIRKGRYGKEYLAQGKQPRPTFLALLQSLKDAYAGTQHYRCDHGAFQDLGEELEPDSIDVILTDPPYGRLWLPRLFRHPTPYARGFCVVESLKLEGECRRKGGAIGPAMTAAILTGMPP